MKVLNATVFPSNVRTIKVEDDSIYGGAHKFRIQNCKGFENGQTQYDDSHQEIQFVQKADDGTITPGLQSEQLLLILIDRHKKLNERFPSREGSLAITKMEESLHWLQARVKERMDRQVMGKLEK